MSNINLKKTIEIQSDQFDDLLFPTTDKYLLAEIEEAASTTRPLILFGDPGVGKTQLAKNMAIKHYNFKGVFRIGSGNSQLEEGNLVGLEKGSLSSDHDGNNSILSHVSKPNKGCSIVIDEFQNVEDSIAQKFQSIFDDNIYYPLMAKDYSPISTEGNKLILCSNTFQKRYQEGFYRRLDFLDNKGLIRLIIENLDDRPDDIEISFKYLVSKLLKTKEMKSIQIQADFLNELKKQKMPYNLHSVQNSVFSFLVEGKNFQDSLKIVEFNTRITDSIMERKSIKEMTKDVQYLRKLKFSYLDDISKKKSDIKLKDRPLVDSKIIESKEQVKKIKQKSDVILVPEKLKFNSLRSKIDDSDIEFRERWEEKLPRKIDQEVNYFMGLDILLQHNFSKQKELLKLFRILKLYFVEMCGDDNIDKARLFFSADYSIENEKLKRRYIKTKSNYQTLLDIQSVQDLSILFEIELPRTNIEFLPSLKQLNDPHIRIQKDKYCIGLEFLFSHKYSVLSESEQTMFLKLCKKQIEKRDKFQLKFEKILNLKLDFQFLDQFIYVDENSLKKDMQFVKKSIMASEKIKNNKKDVSKLFSVHRNSI